MGCLWTWAALQAPKGDISGFTDAEISAAGRYDGEPKAFRRSLKSAKLLDASGRLHDWHKHGITLLLSSRKRQKQYREKLRNGDITHTQQLRPSDQTVPDRTKPDLTVPNLTEPDKPLNVTNGASPSSQGNGYDKDLIEEIVTAFDDEKSRGSFIYLARTHGDGLLREAFADTQDRIRCKRDVINPGGYMTNLLKEWKK